MPHPRAPEFKLSPVNPSLATSRPNLMNNDPVKSFVQSKQVASNCYIYQKLKHPKTQKAEVESYIWIKLRDRQGGTLAQTNIKIKLKKIHSIVKRQSMTVKIENMQWYDLQSKSKSRSLYKTQTTKLKKYVYAKKKSKAFETSNSHAYTEKETG